MGSRRLPTLSPADGEGLGRGLIWTTHDDALPAIAPVGGRRGLSRSGRLAVAAGARWRWGISALPLAVLPLTVLTLRTVRLARCGCPGLATLPGAFGNGDLGPVLQTVGAVGDDLVA